MIANLKWRINKEIDEEVVTLLAKSLSTNELFPKPLARALAARSICSVEQAKEFFKPEKVYLHDPFLMKDMDNAVTSIGKAISKKQKILIYGDYDVDGTTSVSLLCHFFKEINYPFEYYIPDRYKEGYGVSFAGVDYAVNEGVALVIALDCGTKAIDKIQYAKDKGVEFIVCDHHTPGETYPPTVAFLNPKRPDCDYPFKELSACGVGFKLVQALVIHLNETGYPIPFKNADEIVERYADLVTVSIASDIVSITGENRIISYFGLQKIRKNPLPGLKALMDLAEPGRGWSISDIVFFIGPRINSAGRMGSAQRAVKLLLGEEEERTFFAKLLHETNAERKTEDQNITEEALRLIEEDPQAAARYSTVLYQKDWHKGIIGIVASRLIESWYKPTILLTFNEGKWVGSGRSVRGFDLYKALEACSEHIIQFGGHKYAAGLTIEENKVEAFREAFEKVVAKTITEEQRTPVLTITSSLNFSEIDPKFMRLMEYFSPFGPGNSKPVFTTGGVEVTNYRIMKEEHLKLELSHKGVQFEAVGFGMAKKWNSLMLDKLDIAFQPSLKTWKDRTYVQLMIKDFKPVQN